MRYAILPLLMFLSVPAMAQDADKCPITETAQVSININKYEVDLVQSRAIFDKAVADINALAKENGVTLELVSYGYNVYNGNMGGACSQSGNGCNQLSGSITYDVKPLDKSDDFSAALSRVGYPGNLNVNAVATCQ